MLYFLLPIRLGFLNGKDILQFKSVCRELNFLLGYKINWPIDIYFKMNNNYINKLLSYPILSHNTFKIHIDLNIYDDDFIYYPPTKWEYIKSIFNCKRIKREISLPKIHLETLNLRWTYITDIGISYLSNLRVKELNLEGCSITNDGIINLQTMEINKLNLTYCHNISNIGIYYLSNLKITELNVSFCNIDNSCISYLLKMPLKILNISNTSIRDTGFLQLQALNLEKIFLSYKDNITNRSIQQFRQNCPNTIIEFVY